jgi:hypothetical protein
MVMVLLHDERSGSDVLRAATVTSVHGTRVNAVVHLDGANDDQVSAPRDPKVGEARVWSADYSERNTLTRTSTVPPEGEGDTPHETTHRLPATWRWPARSEDTIEVPSDA